MSTELNQKHEAVLCKAAAAIRARGHEGDARLADSVEGIISSLARRASPAAVPEGALPPLPTSQIYVRVWESTKEPGESLQLASQPYFTDEQIQAYARAAVEADRAQRDKLLTIIAYAYQVAGACDCPAHILDVLADPEAATDEQIYAMLPYIPDAASAYRAQQGEPVDCAHCDGHGGWGRGYDAEICPWCYGTGKIIATKAAAPADAPKWGPVHTVGDMVRNLLTLDQAAPIFTAFHVTIDGERRCRTRGVTISRERVIDGKWIDSSRKDVPYANVIWAKPDERSAPAPDTGIPTAGEVERAAFEAWARTACAMPDYAKVNWDAHWTKHAWEGWEARSRRAPVSSTPTSAAVEKAGWKWVPIEPTEDMFVAFAETWFSKTRPIDDCGMDDCYAAMLAAAPSHPSEAKAEENQQ